MKSRLLLLIAMVSFATVSRAAVPGADALVSLMSKEFDANSDGIVDTGEFQSGIAKSFAEMDRDRDGSISGGDIDGLKGELSDDLGEIGSTLVVALIKQIVMTFDKDGDKLASKQEFADGGEAVFKKLDTNNDAQVSKEELAELPTRLLK